MMHQLILDFPDQLREALSIGKAASIRPLDRDIRQIVVAGMGGSGIGADFVAAFIRDKCKAPLLVVKDYVLPAYVGENTLLIASSYSGNTEETLAACRQGMERGARIVAITSGGTLSELARENGWDQVLLPAGQPAPRACLGYSMVAQLSVLQHLGLIGPTLLEEISAAAPFLESLHEEFHEKAKQIAGFLLGKIPVLYTTGALEPVAVRFRQQLAENSKMLSWHHVLPEMNHNELVGWRRDQPGLAAIFFRHSGESPENKLRLDITREVVSEFAASRLEIFAKGETFTAQTLYLVHLVDWISLYLAELQGLDAMEIRIIGFLKEEMAKAKG
ncbi:MAG: bifunctional phosphoglucose/phosphomannose isomerase [Saprospirales bacterium]|nr:bifunctional phosphoglucose/phosphomannose isomerase [Saprospirales bacterium]